jgi:geranylgeranyl pyrophosphate synthase
MKCTSNKQKDAIKQVQKLLKERGSKALEEARKTILQEEIKCKEVRDALTYFMTEYWRDLARPTLLSIACEAVGGDPDITTPIAIPMILISGAIDIHDDIIDQSKVKGSRPTVLGKFGKDIALLVGDALLFKGLTLLHEAVEKGVPAEKLPLIINIIRRTFFELGDAEALELKFRGRTDVTPEEYLNVVRKKAADVEAHTRISVILGSGSEEEIETLGQYGRLLGILIVLGDDLMDTFDVEELRHRVKRESLPLPILYALQNPQVKIDLNSVLLKKMTTKDDAERILELTRRASGLKQWEELVRKLAKEADSCLGNLVYDIKYLKLLIRYVIPPLFKATEFY